MQNLLELIKSVMVSDDVRQKAADLLYAIAEEMNPQTLPLGWQEVWESQIPMENNWQVDLRVDYFEPEMIGKMIGFLKYTGFSAFGMPITQFAYVYDEVFKADGVDEAIDFGKRATHEAVGVARARMKELIDQNKVYIPAVQDETSPGEMDR